MTPLDIYGKDAFLFAVTSVEWTFSEKSQPPQVFFAHRLWTLLIFIRLYNSIIDIEVSRSRCGQPYLSPFE